MRDDDKRPPLRRQVHAEINGKRISKNVYAKTREECAEKLTELIKQMKAEIAEMKKVAKNA